MYRDVENSTGGSSIAIFRSYFGNLCFSGVVYVKYCTRSPMLKMPYLVRQLVPLFMNYFWSSFQSSHIFCI